MNDIVKSKRFIYTPSSFAKDNLIYLQEIGYSETIKLHESSRNRLDSFLFMIVEEGNGIFKYNNKSYELKKYDCAFIDCNKKYSHISDNWKISWIHFYGNNSKAIYLKYLSRNGNNIFQTLRFQEYQNILRKISDIISSDNYLKDININSEINLLLNLLMAETIYESDTNNKIIYNIEEIKNYIDQNYINDIILDDLSKQFFINKYYLTRLFKQTYSTTITNYINNKRITQSKQLLRFSSNDINEIGKEVGIQDSNYFSRLFKKIEGITPNQYRNLWK